MNLLFVKKNRRIFSFIFFIIIFIYQNVILDAYNCWKMFVFIETTHEKKRSFLKQMYVVLSRKMRVRVMVLHNIWEEIVFFYCWKKKQQIICVYKKFSCDSITLWITKYEPASVAFFHLNPFFFSRIFVSLLYHFELVAFFHCVFFFK